MYFFSAEEKNPSHDNRKYSTAVDDIEYLPAAHCHVYLKVYHNLKNLFLALDHSRSQNQKSVILPWRITLHTSVTDKKWQWKY